MTKLNYKKINELCDELFEIQNTQSKLEEVFSKFDPYFTSEDKQNLGSFLEENKRIIEEIKSILKTPAKFWTVSRRTDTKTNTLS